MGTKNFVIAIVNLNLVNNIVKNQKFVELPY